MSKSTSIFSAARFFNFDENNNITPKRVLIMTTMTSDVNLYDVLGVACYAIQEIIRKLFHRLPDKNPDDVKAATVRFQLLQRAVDTLSDPDKRARYNAKHRNHSHQLRPRPGKAPESKTKPSFSSSSSSSSSSQPSSSSSSKPSSSSSRKF